MRDSRRFLVFSRLAATVLLGTPNLVKAHATSGSNCANCHGTPDDTRTELVPNTRHLISNLPVFDVDAGTSVDLKVQVKNGATLSSSRWLVRALATRVASNP